MAGALDLSTAPTVATSVDWASDPMEPPDGGVWDLLVVGGGTAGLVAAHTAAAVGARALLVERARPGGDCLWTGCVPSKALLAAAHAAADARAASRLGVQVGSVEVDFAAVMDRVRATVAAIEPDDSPDSLREAGVRVAHADVHFVGPDAVCLTPADGDAEARVVRFRRAVVATGSSPMVPDVPGLAEAEPLTSETVWELRERPQRLVVLGGGGIGCEIGQAFARLGSRVTLVEAESRLLAGEDEDAAALLAAQLREDGVSVRTGTRLAGVVRGPDGWVCRPEPGGEVVADRVFVAVGREPRTAGLGLEQAGIAQDERGYVRVDARLRTSNPRIVAAGDCTGLPAYTHVAAAHGILAATNALLGLRRRVDLATVPRVTYTQPEVAAFGVSASDGRRAGGRVLTVDHHHVDRARTDAREQGLTRLVLDRRGRLLGATVVGPRAGESLAELVLAARQGLRARDLAGTMHAYPTYDGAWAAALQQVQESLRGPVVRRGVQALAAVNRRRPQRLAGR